MITVYYREAPEHIPNPETFTNVTSAVFDEDVMAIDQEGVRICIPIRNILRTEGALP